MQLHRLGLILLPSLLLACDPPLTPGNFSAQVLDAQTGDSVQNFQEVSQTTEDLSGTWVLVSDWSTCVTVGDKFELRNYEISRVQIVQEGLALHETREDCSVVNTPLLAQTTVVPPPAVQSANPMKSTAFMPSTLPGMPYTGGVEVQTWGLKFGDPLTESMPVDETDSRIVDSDNDGHPGVTLKVGGICELYAIQRAVMVRTGAMDKNGILSGGGTRNIVQVALGASSGFCATQFTTVSNQTDNHWKMRRVDKQGLNLDANGDGKVTCDEIVQNQAAFLQPPTDDWTPPDDKHCENVGP